MCAEEEAELFNVTVTLGEHELPSKEEDSDYDQEVSEEEEDNTKSKMDGGRGGVSSSQSKEEGGGASRRDLAPEEMLMEE